MSFRTALKEWTYRAKDFAQHSAAAAAVSGWVQAGRGAVSRSAAGRLRRYTRAYAKTESTLLRGALAPRIQRLLADDTAGALSEHPKYAGVAAAPQLNRGIVLKAPGPNGERGVIHLTPEYNWMRFLATGTGPADLGERFTFWLTVSWSPADYHLLGLMASRLPGTLFVSPGNRREMAKLEAFHPRVRCLPLIASDWIHPDLFRPKPKADRQTDLLMVANWAPFKRHWHLFAALRHLPAGLRVTMIGQPDESFTLDRIRRQMREAGVRQDVRFLQNLGVREVYDQLCDSRASVIFSRREGACVVVVESLFADTPVGLLRGARIGSADYINDRTGVFLGGGRRAGADLARFLDAADTYQPRAWAVEHLSCHRSIATANAALRDHELQQGRPWTADLTPFCWLPNPTYLRPDDRAALLPTYQELESRYPTAFGPGFIPGALDGTGD